MNPVFGYLTFMALYAARILDFKAPLDEKLVGGCCVSCCGAETRVEKSSRQSTGRLHTTYNSRFLPPETSQ